jgi:uncharacterized membrane protein
MENKNKIIGLKVLMVGMLMIVVLSTVGSALFGVSHSGSEMSLYPGEISDSVIILDNFGDDALDIVVEVTVEEGGEYLSLLEGNIFEVSARSSANVPVRFSVPSSARIGDNFDVKVLFSVVGGTSEGEEEGEGTTIAFSVSPRILFDIEVREKPIEVVEPTTITGFGTATWIMIIVLAVVIIMLIVWMMKRKGSEVAPAVPLVKK